MLVLAFLGACNYPGGTPEPDCGVSSLVVPGPQNRITLLP